LLNGLEAERILTPSELDQLGFDLRLDLDRLGLRSCTRLNPLLGVDLGEEAS
jgi:hypothetical protein